ncbi:MAG: phage holin family protein [bacterium]
MKLISHLLVSMLAIFIASYLVAGTTVTLAGAFLLAVVLGIINLFIKPIVKFITLPITVLTLGISSLFVNALFVVIAARIVPGFYISGFWSAFWFAIALSLITAFFGMFKNSDSK